MKALETEEPDLERAVLLYAEGKELVQRCGELLKNAQQAIDAVNAPAAAGASSRATDDNVADEDEIPF